VDADARKRRGDQKNRIMIARSREPELDASRLP